MNKGFLGQTLALVTGRRVWLEPPWWYRRVGWERSQAQEETAGLGTTQCVHYASLG